MADKTRTDDNRKFLDTAFLYGGNAAWIEQLAASHAQDPRSVPDSWRAFFEAEGDAPDAAGAAARGPAWKREGWPRTDAGEFGPDIAAAPPAAALAAKVAGRAPGADAAAVRVATQDSIRAIMLIRAYRMRGHLAADLDPLGLHDFGPQPELDPASFGFTEADMDRPVFIDGYLGLETATPREMLEILRRTYCGAIGVEFMHISNPQEKAWIQEKFEGVDKSVSFTPEGKKAILRKLIETEAFERFLHKRYPGTKRFGVDGGESVVPALEQIIKRGGALGVDYIVLGMAHRGRLNVLAAVMGKPYRQIFHEFQGGSTQGADEFGSGDVKYHLGASSLREFDGNSVHLSLTANPSHLEIVDPVVLGKVRAKQAKYRREGREDAVAAAMPLIIHGDAAFAGQGVVAECFGLSGLKGHRTGGAIHYIINNQIGFTTNPKDSRSSPYPSDVALMVQAPILHVNGDDPEAVVYAARVAAEYRQAFGKDVVVDMFCYRRFGHNEGDDPSFTQPIMYRRIKDHPSTRELYQRRLVAEGVISDADAQAVQDEFDAFLDAEFEAGKSFEPTKADWLDGIWSGLGVRGDDEGKGDTAVEADTLRRLGRAMTVIPAEVNVHKTLKRVLDTRRDLIEAGAGIDWATAEHLAFASLLDEGFPVRLSGQDSSRGTFSQRHSHIVDQETEARHTPLNHLREGQAAYEVIDTLLSEEAVLGFEYGYALAAPNTLVMWEAQFGDFVNGAQVVIDQFIAAGERKWLRMCGLVMLLPHGYEGQGPEHSSARLERFLQSCAQDNMQVVNCSTPANYFHALRRQIHRNFRKPLIVMTPKSLLRHKRCVSALAEFGPGSSFHRVLWDDADAALRAEGREPLTTTRLAPDADIRRVVLCSGKVYYDLLEAREARGRDDVYLLRVEQFYPVPARALALELARFPKADIVWCQEEPQNMGAWTFMEPNLEWAMGQAGSAHARPRYVGRHAAASTAAGTAARHKAEQDALLDQALSMPDRAQAAAAE